MGLEARPYVGTWKLNNRKVIKHTPDVLCYINGDLTIPGCPTCGGRIDIQQYIDQVSVDPSTEGPATASITLHVPRHAGDGMFRDGNFLLTPGLEVHVYMRGYFPVKGLTSKITKEQAGGLDVTNAVMYPYYHVFHGVVTDANYEYAGGEHRATLSCADMLHFWQYHRIASSGAYFGAKVENSKVDQTFMGHTLVGMSPFAIAYSMFRDVAGSQEGADYAIDNKTGATAKSNVTGESLFHSTELYWEKRRAQQDTAIRMYGADGTLYNAFQAAFLANLPSQDTAGLAKNMATTEANSNDTSAMERAARSTGFNDFDSLTLGAEGAKDDGAAKVDITSLQGFVADIAQFGTVNLFETQYVTKMEIMNTVKQACGYEFYMDVDGDYVFKPPFYNLDTSASRVYRIEDIDIISFSAAEKEPEATAVKVTGSHFRNLKVPGLEGEWGVRAEFVDYRLVAQFGWRQQTYESSLSIDSGAMFFAAIARFDLFNIGVKSATCTIPIRAELRPGFCVYIEFCDCFYYLQSMNHSVSFGGQCTTTLNLVGKRAKFYAPGVPPMDGRKPTVWDIDLANLHLPSLPLEVTEVDGEPRIPRLQGFPNVVMALDPDLVNPLNFRSGTLDDLTSSAAIERLITLVRFGRRNVLQLQSDADGATTDEETKSVKGPFQISTGAGIATPVTTEDLLRQASTLRAAYEDGNKDKIEAASLGECVQLAVLLKAAEPVRARLFPEKGSSAEYLAVLSDQKAAFGLESMGGFYRYYSSSHPDPTMQGMKTIVLGGEGKDTVGSVAPVDSSKDSTATQFVTASSGSGNTLKTGCDVSSGLPLIKSGSSAESPTTVVTPTHQIQMFSLMALVTSKTVKNTVVTTEREGGYSYDLLEEAYQKFFRDNNTVTDVPATSEVSLTFGGCAVGSQAVSGFLFERVASVVNTVLGVTPTFPYITTQTNIVGLDSGTTVPCTMDNVAGYDFNSQLETIFQEMAQACAQAAYKKIQEMLLVAMPLETSVITSHFGAREAPDLDGGGKGSSDHKGIDVGGTAGTPILAVKGGTVTKVVSDQKTKSEGGTGTGYGNYVEITHDDGTITRYAHASSVSVTKDTVVTAGTEIAKVGATGGVTGAHLHFEVLQGGKQVDPEDYLVAIGASNLSQINEKWELLFTTDPINATPAGGSTIKRKSVTSESVTTSNSYLPVFPVSDAQGYEVVGTYRYGRGMTLAELDKYAANRGEAINYDQVDAYIQKITKTGADYAKAIGSLDPATMATLAAVTDDETRLIIKDADGSLTSLGGMNRPATTKEATQKGSVVNAAYNLADLGSVGGKRSVCSCKGAEADTLLQAFDSSLYVGITESSSDDTDLVQDWLTTQMSDAAVDWAATQAAYRGTVLDLSSSNLISAAKDLANSYSNFGASVDQAAANIDSAAARTAESNARLAADIAAFDEEA